MKILKVSMAGVICVFCTIATFTQEHKAINNSDSALQKLITGNKRFVAEKVIHPNQNKERILDVTKGQHPFAIILSCSDSRVPPEIIFDQGIGDLFIVRVAGNIVDNTALGSIEYAVEHLGVRLIVVLGHEKCGAVNATIEGSEAPGHIKYLVEAIKPAVEKAKQQTGNLLDNAIKANVEFVVGKLKSSDPILKEALRQELKIVGAQYDLDDCAVTFY